MFQFDGLKSLLPHAMSEVRHGSMSFRYGGQHEVLQNRLGFLEALRRLRPDHDPLFAIGNGVSMRGGFDPPLDPEKQIRIVGYGDRQGGMFQAEDELIAEAMVTTERGLFFALTVADCLAVVLHEPTRPLLALAHVSRITAGYHYRERNSGRERVPPLLVRLIDFLRDEFAVEPVNLIAAISPGISRSSYLLPWFDNADEPEWGPHCTKTSRGILVDLAGFSRWVLGSQGLLADNIEVAGLDTATATLADGSYQFFSHRRSQLTAAPEGRNAFVTGMPLG